MNPVPFIPPERKEAAPGKYVMETWFVRLKGECRDANVTERPSRESDIPHNARLMTTQIDVDIHFHKLFLCATVKQVEGPCLNPHRMETI